MTQEEKELLLIDLCARLPYKVKLGFENSNVILALKDYCCFTQQLFTNLVFPEHEGTVEYGCQIYDYRPYLRPISSMTDKEMDKLFDILRVDKDGKDEDWIKINDVKGIVFFFPTGKYVEDVAEAYDYLNSIHIDYRGLIHKGLAIEAPEGMYKTE